MKKSAIIIDIDGTLTRDPLLIDDKSRDGRDIFYQKIDNYLRVKKELIKPVVDLVKHLFYSTVQVTFLFLTAREDKYEIRKNTLEFLREEIFYIDDDSLYMREENDLQPNYKVKEQILKEQILPNYDVLFALDDEDKNVEMFRKNGILVLQVKDVANNNR